MMSGQVGPQMTSALNNFGHDRGLAMFADWSSRIAAGEVPPAPPRPQGIERNVVITLWEVGTDRSFIHDVVSTDDRNPTQTPTDRSMAPTFRRGRSRSWIRSRPQNPWSLFRCATKVTESCCARTLAAECGGAVALLG